MTEEGRYRLLIEGISDYAIYMLDPDGRIASWNPAAQRLKGYDASEVLGTHFSRFYPPEEQARGQPERNLRRALEEGRFEAEGWRIGRDGHRFWAHVVIDTIRSPDGEHIGFAKITRDLTERKRAEEALRRSEQQFRLLVQGVTDYAIYMLDTEGSVTSWNPGAQRIKGYEPLEIIGQHFSRFYTPEDRAAQEPEKALEVARSSGRLEKEAWRVRKDGSRFWAHVIIDAIHDDMGEVVGFAKITRDITERRDAQLALEQAREALFQAQKMEAIGQLTGGVAHDFNNLLMAILGSLELVRRRMPYDPRITPLIENAVQGAQRGASLTQRMLAFARRQDLTLEPVDVAALVRGMTDLLQRSLGPSVTISVRFPAGLPPVRSDGNQLEAALLNLAINARDAMPAGGPITITATDELLKEGNERGLSPGRYVRLMVTDKGEGMDAQTLARAVDPFFTTTGVGKGTGLGLPMVHGIAEQSGGRLILRSRLGEGTTAELWLPAAMATIRPPAPNEPDIVPNENHKVILAVDDDALVLLNTVAMLEDLGHAVHEAYSGEEALRILRGEQGRIDLVITDQAMPKMTGVQLGKAIVAEWPDMPVLIATGYAELPADTPPYPRLGKPFTQKELAAAIEAAAWRSRSRTERQNAAPS